MSMMKLTDLDLNQSYTYADYVKWTLEETVELIKGRIFHMAAPLSNHQVTSLNLSRILGVYLKGNKCKVFAAPFDVRLPKPLSHRKSDADIETVVQPDVCIICEPSKIDRRGCIGAPDFIIEILSKSTADKDLKNKFEVYEESGVKEYWIVDTSHKMVIVSRLGAEGKYIADHRPYVMGDVVKVGILPDLNIEVEDVFEGLLNFED